MAKLIEYVLIEVFINKFGNVELRECWRKNDKELPIPISLSTYRYYVNKGIPFRVNAYEPAEKV